MFNVPRIHYNQKTKNTPFDKHSTKFDMFCLIFTDYCSNGMLDDSIVAVERDVIIALLLLGMCY
ncbi:3026_t:CDS:2 [Cetraspora pellucida]|uniref:3026_t:CDS:1 n=1 Tax=Cetraspora pellucida TaxID=1433469 RepID=A0A9N8VQG3_9GLOM|nr:3026_t:CDS:2 [Cetraspora pellucida]